MNEGSESTVLLKRVSRKHSINLLVCNSRAYVFRLPGVEAQISILPRTLAAAFLLLLEVYLLTAFSVSSMVSLEPGSIFRVLASRSNVGIQ
jgi:hypothetical protein